MQAFLLEPDESMCDPNELDTSERRCIDTCLTDADRASLYDCIENCRATKAETQTKCNSHKGKKLIFFIKQTRKWFLLSLNLKYSDGDIHLRLHYCNFQLFWQ